MLYSTYLFIFHVCFQDYCRRCCFTIYTCCECARHPCCRGVLLPSHPNLTSHAMGGGENVYICSTNNSFIVVLATATAQLRCHTNAFVKPATAINFGRTYLFCLIEFNYMLLGLLLLFVRCLLLLCALWLIVVICVSLIRISQLALMLHEVAHYLFYALLCWSWPAGPLAVCGEVAQGGHYSLHWYAV